VPTTTAARLRSSARWLRRRAENVAAALLAAMFLAFIVQIVFRYLLNFPIGWTSELSIITWLWLILWGAAFVVRESDEIRFDIIYGSVGPNARRLMAVIAATALVALYALSLPAVADYVTFMKVEETAYLDIRFDWLFSIYLVFAAASIIRYLWLGWRAVRGDAPEAPDPTKASSGV
jgi:TRAP-type C4-dicarboxylate transport system permease small subunit